MEVKSLGNIYKDNWGTGFPGNVWDKNQLSPTLTTMQGGGRQPMIIDNGSIRKLTPKSCWRLMDFSDEDFHKAKWKTKVMYLEGGEIKCSVKLKAVEEKQRLIDSETCVLCTTNDLEDMEILKTITTESMIEQERGNLQNVNIVIEKLGESEHWGCAINTIRCIDYMGMHFTLTKEKDQHRMGIIALAEEGNTNIGKCMKITTESNLDRNRLYTILTLYALIIKSKIFTATTRLVNIQGYIKLTTDCEKNILLNVSNLRMESTEENMSNSSLYKQAGNSIVRNVLVAIFGQMLPGKEDEYKKGA